MASKKHIDFSISGEQLDQEPIKKEQEIIDIAVNDATYSTQGFVVFKLRGTERKGGLSIGGIDDVVNPKTGKVERMRLLKGVDSIWQKDQKEIEQDYIRQNMDSLVFRGRVCRIFNWETTKLEFARLNNGNIGNPNRIGSSKFEFFEYDSKKQQQEALKREMLELDMAIAAKEMHVDRMKKIASFLGVAFFDEFGKEKDIDGIRREVMLKAKQDPKRFEKLIDSKEVDIAYLVKKAISDSKIDIGGRNGNVVWGSNGSFITKVPDGRNYQEYLIELAMTNSEEGRDFKQKLETFIN